MYYFDEFDGLSLRCVELDIGGQAAGDYLPLSAGQFDANGSDQTYHRGMTVQAALLLVADSADYAVVLARLLAAKIGTRGKLYRQWRDGQREWVYARLVELNGKSTPENLVHQEMSARWQVESPVWSGESLQSVTATISASPQNVTLSNGGTATVKTAVITVTGTATPITSITIGVAGVSEFTWTGTLGTGHTLVIDCGARSVKKDGSDDYDAFTLTANHKITDWLRLAAGDNTVAVTIAPGGALPASVQFDYYDAWR